MKIIARNAAFFTTFRINYAIKLLFDHAAATMIDLSSSCPIFPRSCTTHHTASASAMTTKKSSLGGYLPAWQFLMHATYESNCHFTNNAHKHAPVTITTIHMSKTIIITNISSEESIIRILSV